MEPEKAAEAPTGVSPAGGQADQGKQQDGPPGILLQILAAVATGIGILGFVTFFGGAILWIRAREAGLPGNEAVAVVPKGVLVTTGASFLVPAVLLALVAVGAIYAIHLALYLPVRYGQRQEARGVNQLRYEADQAVRWAEPQEEAARSARELADDLATALAKAEERGGGNTEGLRGEVEKASEEALSKEETAGRLRRDAVQKGAEADNKQAELELALKESPRLSLVRRALELLATGLVLFVIPLWGTDWAVIEVGFWPGVALVLIALAAAGLSLMTYSETEKFLWFGVVAFASVGVFIGVATFFRTTNDPKVEAATALRKDQGPAVGLFVAETPDTLYLGTFFEGRGERRMLAIPRSQVEDIAVGPLLAQDEAEERAIGMAIDLCAQEIRQSKPGADGAACNKQQLNSLKRRL